MIHMKCEALFSYKKQQQQHARTHARTHAHIHTKQTEKTLKECLQTSNLIFLRKYNKKKKNIYIYII